MKALAHISTLFLSAQNEGKILRIHLRILKVSSWEWLSLCLCSQPRMATNIQEVSRKVWSIRLKQQWEQTCQRDYQSLVSQFQPSLWWFKMSLTGTVVKFSVDPIIIYKGVCVGQGLVCLLPVSESSSRVKWGLTPISKVDVKIWDHHAKHFTHR